MEKTSKYNPTNTVPVSFALLAVPIAANKRNHKKHNLNFNDNTPRAPTDAKNMASPINRKANTLFISPFFESPPPEAVGAALSEEEEIGCSPSPSLIAILIIKKFQFSYIITIRDHCCS
jgi:hypothetical protein